jgi:hypothetical protein
MLLIGIKLKHFTKKQNNFKNNLRNKTSQSDWSYFYDEVASSNFLASLSVAFSFSLDSPTLSNVYLNTIGPTISKNKIPAKTTVLINITCSLGNIDIHLTPSPFIDFSRCCGYQPSKLYS